MPKIHFERFDNLLKFLPKSKIKAGDGLDSGKYPFFTSSATLSKFIDTFNYEDESLIFGSGGNASIHYCNQKFATSTDCFVVNQDSEDIDVKYVYYYLKSNIKILEDGFKGAGLKHISKKYISEIKIPLLSLQDQKKIAEILSQIENLINKREESIKLLQELTKSTFLDMFGKAHTFNIIEFGQAIEFLTDYHANGSYEILKKHVELLDSEDYALMIRTTDLENNNFAQNVKYITQSAYDFLTKTKIYGGEIIINKIGSAGNVYLMPNLNKPVSLGMNLFMLKIKKNFNNTFIYYYLNSNRGKLEINKRVKGAVTKSITKDAVRSIPLINPPKPLQDKFAEIVIQIENTKKIYQGNLTELNNLFGSMAQKAFKGELDVGKIELIQKEQEEITMAIKLDENRLLQEIKKGDFEVSKYVNEHQNYDAIKDMIFKLIEDGKISQKFDNDSKKIILEVK